MTVLFNSHGFLFLFLPVVWIVYRVLREREALGPLIWWMAGVSLVFYSCWDVSNLPIIAGSVFGNFLLGRAICTSEGGRATRLVAASVALNLLALGYFKYLGFALGHVTDGFTAPELPLGISFFTFTQVGFLVDCGRERRDPPRFREYLLFVVYFPHLIAGPLLRHAEMLRQFAAWPRARAEDTALGLTFLAMGLFKKTVVADTLSPWVKESFALASPTFAESAFGTLAYTLQLYFDFSAYSDMAIGLSLLFGIRIPQNFDSPYQATSIADFWRRWHMSLSAFLRDYLYVPLGGNRKGFARRLFNVMLVMALGGLWHGAGWTFVCWGVLHGIYLVAYALWQRQGYSMPIPLARALTFVAVAVAWVPFRAADLPSAASLWAGLAGLHGLGFAGTRLSSLGGVSFAFIAALLAWVWFAPNLVRLAAGHAPVTGAVPATPAGALRWTVSRRWALACAILGTAGILAITRVSEFLYFQF